MGSNRESFRDYMQEWTEEQRFRIQVAFLEGERELLERLESSMVAVYLKDVEGRYIAANRWAEILLGFESEEVVGRTDYELFSEEVARVCEANDRAVLEADAPMMFEETFAVAGEKRTCVVSKFPLLGESGKARAICCIATDITERKRTEETLRESEERFRSAFENASTGMALTSLDREYLRVNRALCEILGYSEEELLSKSSSHITHPEDLEKSRIRTEQLLESGGSNGRSIEKRYIRKDGRTVWAISDVSLVHDSQGNPSHFISNFQDITGRKRAEEALRRSEARFRAVFDGAGIGMALVDAEGRLLESNPVLQEMLGYSGEELCKMSFIDVTHPEDMEEDRRQFKEMMAGRLDRFRLENATCAKTEA